MRNFIGTRVKFILDGYPEPVTATVVEDKKDRVLVTSPGSEGRITRIPKQKIVMFEPEEEPGEYVPFHVLACENTSIGCPGVQYIQEGDGFSQNDMEKFMGNCPSRCTPCKSGTKGELRSVDGNFMRGMFANVMFGEYPKKGEKDDKRQDEKTG